MSGNSQKLVVAESPDQVIAVLPFTSFDTTDQANSLAAGIQREIVSRLTAQHVRAARVEREATRWSDSPAQKT